MKKQKLPHLIAFEVTGNYHRAIVYFFQKENLQGYLISSSAGARTREALHNSWDKNDPKDGEIILHLLKTGLFSSIMDYYLPLYFPEIPKYFHSLRAHWFSGLLSQFSTPAAIIKHIEDAFVRCSYTE